ncbi:MAG: PAS domain-containing protein, partial [Bacteroidota bacterium]
MIYIRYTWTRIENEQSEKVLQIARSIEATLPIKELGVLEARPVDITKPQYQIIKNMLKAIISVNPNARFAYIYAEQNGKLYFIADSEQEDSKDYSPPGQEYTEADIAYSQPFKNGKEIVINPVTDRWGTWISVIIPIKNEATGKTVAVFGMDFNAKSWDNLLLFEVIQSSILIVFLLMTLLFLFNIKVKNKSLKSEIAERKQAEDSLLNSENQKAAILRAIPDLLFIFNQNGEYLEVYTEDNSKLLLSKEALIGKKISDLFTPDIAGKAIDAFNQSLQSKELVHFFYSTNISGKTEFYEARIVPASENTVLTIVRDVTERKVAEEVFFQSRERSRAQRNAIARIAEDEDISSGNMTGSF